MLPIPANGNFRDNRAFLCAKLRADGFRDPRESAQTRDNSVVHPMGFVFLSFFLEGGGETKIPREQRLFLVGYRASRVVLCRCGSSVACSDRRTRKK